ncbi:MAG: hypothetical protein II542_07745, partial [Bacteroidales bacterium]|nr:hypothetical protein [Bacteroidales bacterium]
MADLIGHPDTYKPTPPGPAFFVTLLLALQRPVTRPAPFRPIYVSFSAKNSYLAEYSGFYEKNTRYCTGSRGSTD